MDQPSRHQDFVDVREPFDTAERVNAKLRQVTDLLVPSARIERALPCGKRILSPLRLPIPPRGLVRTVNPAPHHRVAAQLL